MQKRGRSKQDINLPDRWRTLHTNVLQAAVPDADILRTTEGDKLNYPLIGVLVNLELTFLNDMLKCFANVFLFSAADI